MAIQNLTASPISIPVLVKEQQEFFQTEQTRSITFRLEQLAKLKQVVIDRQAAILQAVKADLGRPAFEGYFEIATIGEINLALKNLKTWARPRRVKTPIDQFPASAFVYPQPLGLVLIIGPWNYPFQLLMSPLVGAIAAGNCAILKPSEHAPHTSRVVAEMIADTFDPSYITVCEGDANISQQLLAEKFDHIFFTGGTAIGRIIMAAAAKYLTPVTLELGGKSPCIVDIDIDVDIAAKRIAWGKLINTGQTCIAPDYLLVHRQIKDSLVDRIKHHIKEFYGSKPAQSPDYGRIIHRKHFDRLIAFLDQGEIILGGDHNADDRYIAPTLIDGITWDDPVMQGEIFGPILPILTYDDLEDAIAQVNAHPKPLALYFFSTNPQKQERILYATSSGGVCLNDVVMQVGVNSLPFGGVGESGMGTYHGEASFKSLSHHKSVLRRGFWLALSWVYPPYTTKKLEQFKGIVSR
jgi:aldehyde dehydrogenase (NAD+)